MIDLFEMARAIEEATAIEFHFGDREPGTRMTPDGKIALRRAVQSAAKHVTLGRRAIEALRPFAKIAAAIDDSVSCSEHKRPDDTVIYTGRPDTDAFDITMRHLRTARAIVDEADGKTGETK